MNKFTSDTMTATNKYSHVFEVSGSNINIYSLNGNMDPRTTNANDKYVVFWIEGVFNPNAKYVKTSLAFTFATCRYTYSMGPMLVYEDASNTFSDDLVVGSIPAQKCDFSNAAKYGSYITSKEVPVNLNIFVDFEFTTENPLIAGGKIVVELDGME